MTQEEKRIAIAEKCGWTATVDDDQFWRATRADGSMTSDLWCSMDNVWSVGIPDYFNDLNACHEMEKILTSVEALTYGDWLMELLKKDRRSCITWSATAAQRCEAFGKTLRIW